MKVSEKAADAQRKTCKRAPESLGNKIYINVVARDFCTALFVYQKFSLLVQYLKCILIHDLNSMWWQEHSEKKKSMSMYLRSRAAADLRGPSCARWLEFQSITLWSQQCYVSDWRLSWCITVGLTVNEKWLTLCHLWKVVLSHATDRQVAGLVDGKNPAPYLEC